MSSGSTNSQSTAPEHEQDEKYIIGKSASSPRITTRPGSSTVQGPEAIPSIPAAIPAELGRLNSPTASEGVTASITHAKSLWDQAYERFQTENPDIAKAYEDLLSRAWPHLAKASSTVELEIRLSRLSCNLESTDSTSKTTRSKQASPKLVSQREMMDAIIRLGQKHMDENRITLRIWGQEFFLDDGIQAVAVGVQATRDVISDALQSSPTASTAWAGVCLLLPLLTNASEVQQASDEGLAYVIQQIQYYTAMESHMLRGTNKEFLAEDIEQVMEESFVKLYEAIIEFQAQTVLRFFRRRFKNLLRDTVKWDPWEEMLRKVKDLSELVEKQCLGSNAAASRRALTTLATRAREAQEQNCLQSFKKGDYAWYKDRVEDRVSNTCLWFLNHASYRFWLESKSGPLLVSADPGCGKSVVAKYLIDSNFGFQIPKEAAICYFFFKEGVQNTVARALCALIHQLLCLRPELMRHAIRKYEQMGPSLADDSTALWNILESAASDPAAGTVIIVLDALDECDQDERNMQTLSRWIRKHFDDGGPKKLKVFMTSRPYQDTMRHIQELERSFPNIRIKGEDESEILSKEINAVIEYRVSRLQHFDTRLKEHLKQRLEGISHRTYLWLYLVMSYLETSIIKNTTRGIDQVIENLPVTVEDSYEKILSWSREPETTRKALAILLAAYQPLTLRQMQIALDLNPKTGSFEDLDLEPDEKFKDRLRELCGLFVTVHQGQIYFLHQTVKEFLLSGCTPPTREWAHTFNMKESHAILAEKCVRLLSFGREDMAEEDTMFRYSGTYWVDHFREADVSDDTTVEMALRLCDPSLGIYSSWAKFHYIRSNSIPEDIDDTGLVQASYFGLKQVVSLILDRDNVDTSNMETADVNFRHKLVWDTALHIAVERDHIAVVKLLLSTNHVDIRSKNKGGRAALHLAAENGSDAVVQLLLDTGQVDTYSQDKNGRTPLHYVASSGSEAVVQLLLDTGQVDINSQDKYGRTPLHYAAILGSEAVVQLLLDTGQVDINSQDEDGRTPLHHAARNGSNAVVQLLLNTGQVNINSQDKYSQTPLHYAAILGSDAVVKLLLDTGQVDINS